MQAGCHSVRLIFPGDLWYSAIRTLNNGCEMWDNKGTRTAWVSKLCSPCGCGVCAMVWTVSGRVDSFSNFFQHQSYCVASCHIPDPNVWQSWSFFTPWVLIWVSHSDASSIPLAGSACCSNTIFSGALFAVAYCDCQAMNAVRYEEHPPAANNKKCRQKKRATCSRFVMHLFCTNYLSRQKKGVNWVRATVVPANTSVSLKSYGTDAPREKKTVSKYKLNIILLVFPRFIDANGKRWGRRRSDCGDCGDRKNIRNEIFYKIYVNGQFHGFFVGTNRQIVSLSGGQQFFAALFSRRWFLPFFCAVIKHMMMMMMAVSIVKWCDERRQLHKLNYGRKKSGPFQYKTYWLAFSRAVINEINRKSIILRYWSTV